MAQTIIDLLNDGLSANVDEKFRCGNLIHLHDSGSVVVTGDIHGHRRNFERILTYADLENNPDRHLILQEIIHGGPEDEHGDCLSYQLLFDAIRYKLKFPDRVHFVMGNHDTAYINNSKVMKNGKEMNASMRSAMRRWISLSTRPVSSANRSSKTRAICSRQPLASSSSTRSTWSCQAASNCSRVVARTSSSASLREAVAALGGGASGAVVLDGVASTGAAPGAVASRGTSSGGEVSSL